VSITARVRVPATTANIGPGFDCLGAALTLYNQFDFTPLTSANPLQVTVDGPEADRLITDERNLVYQAFLTVYQKLGQTPPPLSLRITLGVPLSRGLGSSSTAIVGGLLGANVLAGSPLDDQALAALAIDLEGHPDNVVPALLGGCRLAATHPHGGWTLCDIPWHESLVPVVAIPEFELSTAEARRVLPDHYSRADAIFNAAHLGLLLRGISTGHEDWVRTALCDRIHQPYRQILIPGYDVVQQAALAAGAWGLVISGAGPTLLTIATPATVDAVQKAIQTAWQRQDFAVMVHPLKIDHHGATVKVEQHT
jgi:homoserine kinase